MTWVLAIGAGWLLLATLIAVLIGRSVRLADAHAAADAVHHEPNFVVDPVTAPAGFAAASVLPFPAIVGDAAQAPTPRPAADPSTVPGIPVARPKAPGAHKSGGHADQIRRTGLG